MKTNISIENKTGTKYCIDNCLPYLNLQCLQEKLLNFRFSILHSCRENCIHTKINQDFLLHIQNQKFKGLLCTVKIVQKTVKLRN